MSGIRAVLRALAQHPGGCHSSNPELAQWDSGQVGRQARAMVARGHLFSAKVRRRHVRYFATAADRDAFMAKHNARLALKLPSRVSMLAPGEVAQWPADAPAVETPRTVHTECPAFVPRFREFVFPFVHGGLRCA